MTDLSNLKPAKGATRDRKRVGRGQGSTLGDTAGRGDHGQKARSGGNIRRGFEGGQMPLQRRLPKRGFHNINTKDIGIVNVEKLESYYDDGEMVTHASLLEKGLVRKNLDGVKVLGRGELTKALTVQVYKVSSSAAEKIANAGGAVEVTGV